MAVNAGQSAALVERLSAAELSGLSDSVVKPLVKDLHRVRPGIYWADFLLTSLLAWAGFSLALVVPPWSILMFLGIFLAVLAFYRGLCFVHELSHQTERTLPGFNLAYNLLAGFPMLMPSFIYVGVHQNHHKISCYGTDKDPEYLPFAHSRLMTGLFAAESFLIPFLLLIRFVCLTPFGFVSARFQCWLVAHASSLTMNVKYTREPNHELVRQIRIQSLFLCLAWGAYLTCVANGLVSLRILWTWLAVCSLVSFINTVRTLGAHDYQNEGEPMDRMAQLRDSIDTPGAFWTELWAPVGLRYHALHHYFPGIPYHSLPEAYRRIANNLAISAEYKEMTSPSLPASLTKLWNAGLGRD
jgi:fatty acid desaturase